MKIKQKVEKSGVFVEPDIRDLLVPEIIVCPECGSLIYPRGGDVGRAYYFPNMSNEHRYHTKHFARAAFTCSECGCKFSRTADTYTEFNWDKIKLDISKILMVLSIATLILCALNILINDNIFGVLQIVTIISSYVIFFGSLMYYWRNS